MRYFRMQVSTEFGICFLLVSFHCTPDTFLLLQPRTALQGLGTVFTNIQNTSIKAENFKKKTELGQWWTFEQKIILLCNVFLTWCEFLHPPAAPGRCWSSSSIFSEFRRRQWAGRHGVPGSFMKMGLGSLCKAALAHEADAWAHSLAGIRESTPSQGRASLTCHIAYIWEKPVSHKSTGNQGSAIPALTGALHWFFIFLF